MFDPEVDHLARCGVERLPQTDDPRPVQHVLFHPFQDNLCPFIRADIRPVDTLIDEDEVISVPFDTRMLARRKLSGNLEITLFAAAEDRG